MKHSKILLLVTFLTFTASGCALTESATSAFRQTARMFRPNPYDRPFQPDVEDEWAFVGEEGRGDQERERDPDRWWQNLVMSPQARNIERNLGID